MREAETYWKSLWGEESQLNERAEWIRREEKRKIRHMDWRPNTLCKLLCTCQKFTIGNLLEMIKYKITGLKLSQLLTGILQKTLMK
jgi:hypothetical protein